MSAKTEPPTPRRLAQARERGEVPSSRRWISGASTAGALVALVATLPSGVEHLKAWTERALSAQDAPVAAALDHGTALLVRLAALPLLAAFIASLASGAVLSGVRFAPSVLLPRWDRISLAAGVRRHFGAQALLRGLAAVAAGLFVLWAGWTAWDGCVGALTNAARLDGLRAGHAAVEAVRRVLARAAIALFAMAVADLGLARVRHRRALRMTREEVRRELREAEGDPRHRQERRHAHRRLAEGGRARGVANATAVVVNPTHIAVALRYRDDECEAPFLVAKGEDGAALALRFEAERLGIPVVQNIPLARRLVRFDLGTPVPEELYQATAAVLAAVAMPKPNSPALWSSPS